MSVNDGNDSAWGRNARSRGKSALRRLNTKALGLTLLACMTAACDQPHGMARNKMPSFGFGPSDPTVQDASNAMRVIGPHLGVSYSIYSVGTPQQCQSGSMNGADIRACNVCATILTIRHTGVDGSSVAALHLEHGLFNVAFKRALSVEQPDVAPTDGGGVWVAAFPASNSGQPTAPPPFRPNFAIDLGPDALASVNLMLQPLGYTQGYQVHPTGNGLTFPLSDQAILSALDTPAGKSLVQRTAGSCS